VSAPKKTRVEQREKGRAVEKGRSGKGEKKKKPEWVTAMARRVTENLDLGGEKVIASSKGGKRGESGKGGSQMTFRLGIERKKEVAQRRTQGRTREEKMKPV